MNPAALFTSPAMAGAFARMAPFFSRLSNRIGTFGSTSPNMLGLKSQMMPMPDATLPTSLSNAGPQAPQYGPNDVILNPENSTERIVPFWQRFSAATSGVPTRGLESAGLLSPSAAAPVAPDPTVAPAASAGPSVPVPRPRPADAPFSIPGMNDAVGNLADPQMSYASLGSDTKARQIFDPVTGQMMNDFYTAGGNGTDLIKKFMGYFHNKGVA